MKRVVDDKVLHGQEQGENARWAPSPIPLTETKHKPLAHVRNLGSGSPRPRGALLSVWYERAQEANV